MHQALLLIEISLISKTIKRQNGIVFRENGAHERCAIKIMTSGPFFNEVYEGLRADPESS